MFNRVIITGRLAADPELRSTPNNIYVTSFSLANEREYKSKDGKRECDFYVVVAWQAKAQFVCQYFKKGSPILVEGRLQTRSYVDKQGNNRSTVEIVAENIHFYGGKKEDTSPSTTQKIVAQSIPVAVPTVVPAVNQAGSTLTPDFWDNMEIDDDLPF